MYGATTYEWNDKPSQSEGKTTHYTDCSAEFLGSREPMSPSPESSPGLNAHYCAPLAISRGTHFAVNSASFRVSLPRGYEVV